MKITGVKIVKRVTGFEPKYKSEDRQCGMLDIYADDQWDREREREREMPRSAPALMAPEHQPRSGTFA